MTRLRGFYGGSLLHLLATVMSFALVAAAFVGWARPGSDLRGVLTWVLGCLTGSELMLLPSAWLLDRIATGSHASTPSAPARGDIAYVFVPTVLSGLLLVVFAPLVFRFDEATFSAATAMTASPYLARWLLSTAVLFGASALIHAFKTARARRHAA